MGLDLTGISDGVGEFVVDVFTAAGPLAVTETAKVLRDGIPVPGYVAPAIGVEIGRRACKRYADNAAVFPSDTAVQFENLCRPYLDDIGYGTAPSVNLPFRGGQCYDGGYTFTFTATNLQGQRVSSQQGTGGRLIGVDTVTDSGSGLRTAGYLRQLTPASPIDFIGIQVGNPGANLNPVISNVVRNGGLPDECGNPPPIVTQPDPDPAPLPPGPTPFNPEPGIDIDIDVDIDIDPVIGPRITFDIGDGPVVIDPFPEGGGGDDDGSGSPVSGLPPGDIGDPGAPEDTETTGKASGCAPPNSVLVGVKVNILASPPFGSEYDPSVRRGACYVYMGTVGNLALEPAGVALRSGQMFFAPLDNLTCWEVDANSGYVLQVIPYYRALEPQEV